MNPPQAPSVSAPVYSSRTRHLRSRRVARDACQHRKQAKECDEISFFQHATLLVSLEAPISLGNRVETRSRALARPKPLRLYVSLSSARRPPPRVPPSSRRFLSFPCLRAVILPRPVSTPPPSRARWAPPCRRFPLRTTPSPADPASMYGPAIQVPALQVLALL